MRVSGKLSLRFVAAAVVLTYGLGGGAQANTVATGASDGVPSSPSPGPDLRAAVGRIDRPLRLMGLDAGNISDDLRADPPDWGQGADDAAQMRTDATAFAATVAAVHVDPTLAADPQYRAYHATLLAIARAALGFARHVGAGCRAFGASDYGTAKSNFTAADAQIGQADALTKRAAGLVRTLTARYPSA